LAVLRRARQSAVRAGHRRVPWLDMLVALRRDRASCVIVSATRGAADGGG
jgi:hypothetical protein